MMPLRNLLRALIGIAFLEGSASAAVLLIHRAMPLATLVGAPTNVDALAEIVLPYISTADNSALDPKPCRDPSRGKNSSATSRFGLVCEDGVRLLQKAWVS